jgi:hypothetical protein
VLAPSWPLFAGVTLVAAVASAAGLATGHWVTAAIFAFLGALYSALALLGWRHTRARR